MFGTQMGTELSTRLYTHFIKQNWLFHASVNSAKLTKKIVNETNRVSGGIILPLMQMNARIVFTIFMVVSIFIYDPRVAIIGITIFAIVYLILFKVVKSHLERNGKAISEIFSKRYRLNNEGFGGIKDLLLMGRDDNYIKSFKQTSQSLAYSQGTNNALAQVPRYFIEIVAFGSMMTITLYLISNYNGDLGKILPTLSLYTLAAFKLLPAIQNIYANVAAIRGNIAAFYSIQKDLIWSMQTKVSKKETEQKLHAC